MSLICPECKCDGDFLITAFASVVVNNKAEVQEVQYDHEWDDKCDCFCIECGHNGTVKDFTVKED